MDPKKMLSKELTAKFGDHVNEEAVSESVDKFFQHGNTFLLLELMNLKSEIKSLREELERRRDKANSVNSIVAPDV
jgi:hypothetical protein